LSKTELKKRSFELLQDKWYARLAKEGFEDQEDHRYEDRPLKKWRRTSWNFDHLPKNASIVSAFPEGKFDQKLEFSNHPEFLRVCRNLSRHGNSKLTTKKARLIWADHINGNTLRQIEKRRGISDTRIFFLISKITEYMNLMDTRAGDPSPGEETSKIILRTFNPKEDSGMVYKYWRDSLWFDEERDPSLSDAFYVGSNRHIKSVLSHVDTKIHIACLEENPILIVGYSVMRGNHIEWVYVKINYRKKGIAELLTRNFSTISPPPTKIGKDIATLHNLIIKENENGTASTRAEKAKTTETEAPSPR
jgi:hypothetical protein